jgi:hypothetical protein
MRWRVNATRSPALNHHHYRRLTTSAMAPKRKATRQPTMERPRTRAQVQRRGPSSPHMDTRESRELSTPPREETEPEPHREEMDTGDSPTGELQDSRQQSGSETGREMRMSSRHHPMNLNVTGRCLSCLPLSGKRERLFSAAGNAQERHQARMAPETLQALITLRAWWKQGVLGFDSVVA